MAKVVFKKDRSDQLMLLPPDLGSFIPENHLVRVVDKVIDELKLSPLFDTYKGGGTSSYSPRMLLKVITYAYIEKIYTSRPIAKALKENIYFMWLSGMSTPDFTTVNNFRSKRLKESVDDVFSSVIEVMIKGGYIKAENLFVDGTKIEANANKYSYIWKKNVERHESMVKENIKKLLSRIEELQKAEDTEYGSHDLEEYEGKISAEQIDKVVSEINQKISKWAKSNKSKVRELKNESSKLKKYEDQKKTLGGRNSCSKTDNDATFFRMKEDTFGSQLKPAYNVQIATENQFILGYGIYQKAADTSVFIPFMNRLQSLNIPLKNVIADAGYGSEENYEYAERNDIGNYMKYNNFDYEKTKSYKEKKFISDHFVFDKDNNQYMCSSGQKLDFAFIKKAVTENGYEIEKMVYRSKNCAGCSYQEKCCKGQNNRSIEVSHKLIDYKNIVRKNLESETGKKLTLKRGVDVESVFGQIKHNNKFRRFNTRGIKNVSTEWGIISIAHNIKKMAN
ncbi:MAG: IS1182 family transposase [Methanosarcina sp.]